MTELLQKSIDKYRAIIEHAEQLDQLLGMADPEHLVAYTLRMKELQEEAGLNDQDLLTEIAQNLPAWRAHPLFRERMQLLEQIMEMNDLLLPKIRGMMSVTAAELVQLKEGRAAVSGYNQTPARIIKSNRGVG
jgi:hypothetical protein